MADKSEDRKDEKDPPKGVRFVPFEQLVAEQCAFWADRPRPKRS